ncbi:hypothetical protein [Primorskyibacter flagellatus]|uniref:Uncharacterized protein n=1 Tax=Primorskyibacter flagellatus TaxID=1387277 RepID=A0A1W2E4E8_9RHOB|nr:hypothetical protein [Primorskyibacter flagellatus]SMD04721.1 hypothetical protein SAMN06295998_12239 [Primorskyibacter flagellatus]
MTDQAKLNQTRFRVIEGARDENDFRLARRAKAMRPLNATVGVSELAAEMAVIYALSLLRDVALTDLENPHHGVRIDAQTSFTLHELLCELRSLPWLDRHAIPCFAEQPDEPARHAAQDDEHMRRASRWNKDGQLTLRMLVRGATRTDICGPLLSQLMPSLEPSQAGPDGADLDRVFETLPAPDAPAVIWKMWLNAKCCEAETPAERMPRTLRELAVVGHPASPGRAVLALGLAMSSIVLPPVTALAGRGWGGAELLSVMAEAVLLAKQASRAQAALAGPMPRPALLAARLSLMVDHASVVPANPADVSSRQILEELRRFAPRLLTWVARRNAVDGSASIDSAVTVDAGPRLPPATRRGDNLMLPHLSQGDATLRPLDAQSQGTVAGACLTILKAVYAGPLSTSSHRQRTGKGAAHMGSSPHMLPRRPGLSGDLDKLASNMVLGRLVTGGYFHLENLAALRKGERIAMALLSELAESGRASGDLGFISFDGKPVRISARRRACGSVRAEISINGCPVSDIGNTGSPRPALRAV